MTFSMDADQTAPTGSTLFASILKLVINVRQLFASDAFSRRHFSDTFLSWRFKGKYPFIFTVPREMPYIKNMR